MSNGCLQVHIVCNDSSFFDSRALSVYVALLPGTMAELTMRVDMPAGLSALAVHYLHFHILLHWKCKSVAPLAISDRYREGRDNWFVTDETCKKVIVWTAYAAPLVVSPILFAGFNSAGAYFP